MNIEEKFVEDVLRIIDDVSQVKIDIEDKFVEDVLRIIDEKNRFRCLQSDFNVIE